MIFIWKWIAYLDIYLQYYCDINQESFFFQTLQKEVNVCMSSMLKKSLQINCHVCLANNGQNKGFICCFSLLLSLFGLCWVFVALHRLFSSCGGWGLLFIGDRLLIAVGFSCCWVKAPGEWDSVVVAHRLSCSAAYGIFPDQGLNPCPLHWQVDSYPLSHQGSPVSGLMSIYNPQWVMLKK